jgi:hypothetical protein
MKTRYVNFWLRLTILSTVTTWVAAASGQGTITFDAHNNWVGTNYAESGMAFRLIIPQGSSIDYFGITYGAGNTPSDGTPYMQWFRQNNPYNYVSLRLTNGSTFGLTSVWLADPTAPSPSQVLIGFVGFKADGSTVTNTLTTPGNGADYFLTYQFTPDFASSLTSVEIDATRWAMDNLVFVIPEPGTGSLLALGLLALGACKLRRRGKAVY